MLYIYCIINPLNMSTRGWKDAIPILEMGEVKHREVEYIAYGYAYN